MTVAGAPGDGGKGVFRGRVLAIDPGRDKCGLAVVEASFGKGKGDLGRFFIHTKEVIPRGELLSRVEELLREYGPRAIVIGNGTGARAVLGELYADLGREALPDVYLIDESRSSEEARRWYLLEHRPQGIGRFLPLSLRYPDKPYDDYVAVILAERFIASPSMVLPGER